MKVYILTREPYHYNSTIISVYTDEESAIAALKEAPDPTNINCDDFMLTEWDLEKNEEGRHWHMTGKQVYETGPVPWSNKLESHPVRKEFTFEGPS